MGNTFSTDRETIIESIKSESSKYGVVKIVISYRNKKKTFFKKATFQSAKNEYYKEVIYEDDYGRRISEAKKIEIEKINKAIEIKIDELLQLLEKQEVDAAKEKLNEISSISRGMISKEFKEKTNKLSKKHKEVEKMIMEAISGLKNALDTYFMQVKSKLGDLQKDSTSIYSALTAAEKRRAEIEKNLASVIKAGNKETAEFVRGEFIEQNKAITALKVQADKNCNEIKAQTNQLRGMVEKHQDQVLSSIAREGTEVKARATLIEKQVQQSKASLSHKIEDTKRDIDVNFNNQREQIRELGEGINKNFVKANYDREEKSKQLLDKFADLSEIVNNGFDDAARTADKYYGYSKIETDKLNNQILEFRKASKEYYDNTIGKIDLESKRLDKKLDDVKREFIQKSDLLTQLGEKTFEELKHTHSDVIKVHGEVIKVGDNVIKSHEDLIKFRDTTRKDFDDAKQRLDYVTQEVVEGRAENAKNFENVHAKMEKFHDDEMNLINKTNDNVVSYGKECVARLDQAANRRDEIHSSTLKKIAEKSISELNFAHELSEIQTKTEHCKAIQRIDNIEDMKKLFEVKKIFGDRINCVNGNHHSTKNCKDSIDTNLKIIKQSREAYDKYYDEKHSFELSKIEQEYLPKVINDYIQLIYIQKGNINPYISKDLPKSYDAVKRYAKEIAESELCELKYKLELNKRIEANNLLAKEIAKVEEEIGTVSIEEENHAIFKENAELIGAHEELFNNIKTMKECDVLKHSSSIDINNPFDGDSVQAMGYGYNFSDDYS